jgi:ubiquinone/menaquinone biosynthesis C-methylase UbiE
MRRLLAIFFQLFYHSFAWTYDFVAAAVSLGRWQTWAMQARPFMSGRVLEIGFGPGHLQIALNADGLAVFGLDESRQMSRQATRRLRKVKYPRRIIQGYAQKLPFPHGDFDRVVATFPSEFIFEEPTLREIHRVLRPAGELVIVPSAWITGKGLLERLAAGLFLVTGQAGILEQILPGMKRRISDSGFLVRHELLELEKSRVMVIIATKPS